MNGMVKKCRKRLRREIKNDEFLYSLTHPHDNTLVHAPTPRRRGHLPCHKEGKKKEGM
jgi:hypothetical protein